MRTLMADVQRLNEKLLELTCDLAARLDATVIGISARRPRSAPYEDYYVGDREPAKSWSPSAIRSPILYCPLTNTSAH